MGRHDLLAAAASLTLTAAAGPVAAADDLAPPSPASAVKGPEAAAAGVTAGRLIVERPTLETAGFEWLIDGDANRNAQVSAVYRETGARDWRATLPLMRLQYEEIKEDPTDRRQATLHPATVNYTAPNAFAGSVFHLRAGARYEFRFTLTDPDGVTGQAVKTASLQMRSEPRAPVDGRVLHVYPIGWNGPKQEPAFTGLLAAYYTGAFDADYWNAYPPRVRPGDTILVHAGTYKDTAFRYYYGHTTPVHGQPLVAYGTFFDGTYYLHASGTAKRPITIKAAGDGEVVFDGNGAGVLFDLTKANYNSFDGITVRNATIAFLLGRKAYGGADGFALTRSRIEDVARGVHDDWGLSKDYYIADNTFIGRTPPDRIVGYGSPELYGKDPAWPVPINMRPGGSEYAVKVYGQGHVVAYNLVRNWHDGIDVATYGNPDAACELCGVEARKTTEDDLPGAIDFYGNDMSNFNDNCFEFDGGARNIRVFENRCFNDSNTGMSINPGFGGPFYFVRNVLYNQVSGVNGCAGQCAGMLFYQNTIIAETRAGGGGSSNIHFLNNLIVASGAILGNTHSQKGARLGDISADLGVAADAGTPGGPLLPTFAVDTRTSYSSSDYNGFRVDPRASVAFRWSAPPAGVVADFDYGHPPQRRSFKRLKDYAAATGQDRHSVLVDFDSFVKMTPPDRLNYQRIYDTSAVDFRLRAKSPAIDAGVSLPTITDGYAGRAPDLGAIEYGQPEPHYGPRPRTP